MTHLQYLCGLYLPLLIFFSVDTVFYCVYVDKTISALCCFTSICFRLWHDELKLCNLTDSHEAMQQACL